MSNEQVWDGTGKPPVGTICEALARQGAARRWQKAEVLKHSGSLTAVHLLATTELTWATEFRLVQDEETQLASFIRDHGIPVVKAKEIARALLDAGLSGIDFRGLNP